MTQWAAQFAVASELCKRGYDVGFTMGHNTPLADLFAIAPDGRTTFLVDVKGQRTANFWQIKPKVGRSDLFYILAYVPPGKPNRFFVMSHAEVATLLDEYKHSGIKFDERFPGMNWTTPHRFENNWGKLPGGATP
ncbi:MAG: hypothetical protein ABIK36_05015 [Pseudomonadota bacterium]